MNPQPTGAAAGGDASALSSLEHARTEIGLGSGSDAALPAEESKDTEDAEDAKAKDVGFTMASFWRKLFKTMQKLVTKQGGSSTSGPGEILKLDRFCEKPDDHLSHSMIDAHARFQLPHRSDPKGNEFMLTISKEVNWWLRTHKVHVPKERLAEFHVRYAYTVHHAQMYNTYVYPIAKRLTFTSEGGTSCRWATRPFLDIDWKVEFDRDYVTQELGSCEQRYPITFGNKSSWVDLQDKHFVPNFSTPELEYLGKVAVSVFVKSFHPCDGSKINEDDVVAIVIAPPAADLKDDLTPECCKDAGGNISVCPIRFRASEQPKGKLSCHIFILHKNLLAEVPRMMMMDADRKYQPNQQGHPCFVKLWDKMQAVPTWLLSQDDWNRYNQLVLQELEKEYKQCKKSMLLARGKQTNLPPRLSVMQGVKESSLLSSVDTSVQNLLLVGSCKFKKCAICELIRTDDDFKGIDYCNATGPFKHACNGPGTAKEPRISSTKMKRLGAVVVGQNESRALLQILGGAFDHPPDLCQTMFTVFATSLSSMTNEMQSNVVMSTDAAPLLKHIDEKIALHKSSAAGRSVSFTDPQVKSVVQSIITGRMDVGTNQTQQRYPVQMYLSASTGKLTSYFSDSTGNALPSSADAIMRFALHLWRVAMRKQDIDRTECMDLGEPLIDDFELDEPLGEIEDVDFYGLILSKGREIQNAASFEARYDIDVAAELVNWNKMHSTENFGIQMTLMQKGSFTRGLSVKLAQLRNSDEKQFTFCWHLFEERLNGIGKDGQKIRPWKYWDFPGTVLENRVGYVAADFTGIFKGDLTEFEEIPVGEIERHYPAHDSAGHMGCWEVVLGTQGNSGQRGGGDYEIYRTCFRCKQVVDGTEKKYRSRAMKLHWKDSRSLHELLNTDPENKFGRIATRNELSGLYGKRCSDECMRDPVCRDKSAKQARGIWLEKDQASKRSESSIRFGD